MPACKVLPRIVAATMLVVHPGIARANGVTVMFTSPNVGQEYGINAPIHYTGTVSWTQGATATIQVDYLHSADGSTSRILDSEEADWSQRDVGAGTGSWKNKNPATLSATQWNNNESLYLLRATPYTASSPYYDSNWNIIYTEIALGDVS